MEAASEEHGDKDEEQDAQHRVVEQQDAAAQERTCLEDYAEVEAFALWSCALLLGLAWFRVGCTQPVRMA